MDFLSELLSSFLGGDVIKALAKKTGIKASDLKKFVSQALPYLLAVCGARSYRSYCCRACFRCCSQ